MKLVRRNPWNALDPLRDDLSRFFSHAGTDLEHFFDFGSNEWMPPVDLKETENGYRLDMDLPGVNPDELDVHIENGHLTIKGERKTEAEEKKEGFYRLERTSGSFYRRIALPDDAANEPTTADLKDGVLTIELGRRKEAPRKKIEIKH